MSDGEAEPASRVLTPAEQSKALALFRDLLDLRDQGIKLILLHNEEEMGLRAIGQRRAVSLKLS